jgi:hypothetical protein
MPCINQTPCPGNFFCGIESDPFIRKTCVDGVQLTPFAEVMFLDANVNAARPAAEAEICTGLPAEVANQSLCQITQNSGLYVSSGVGNKCTTDCNITLKSLQVGVGGEGSSGHKIVAEIIDERGGSLKSWFDKLLNDRSRAETAYKMVCRFGWVAKGAGASGGQACQDASATGTSVITSSGLIYAAPRDLRVKFEGGRTKFEIEGTDMTEWREQDLDSRAYGTERDKWTFRRALNRLMRDHEVNIVTNPARMRFKVAGILGFSSVTEDGPSLVWPLNGQGTLAVLHDWIRLLTTESGKGIFITSNAARDGRSFTLWEDTVNYRNRGLCEEQFQCSRDRVIGHYVVNGGNCSPVISFTPEFAFDFQGSSGLTRSVEGNNVDLNKFPKCPGSTGNGPELHIGINRQALDALGPNYCGDGLKRAVEAHIRANRTQLPIKADLKVQGDPRITHQNCFIGKYVSLVVYGAYYANRVEGDQCPAWTGLFNEPGIAASPCVDFLSAPDWMVMGMDHSIRDGTFHTTYTLRLIRQPPALP